jgi:hypothetical protein
MSTMRHFCSGYIRAALCLCFILQVASAHAQWSFNGSNIYFNGGNVGIGTAAPGARLSFGSYSGGTGSFDFYDGGVTFKFGTGINSSEQQFYGFAGGHWSFNSGGTLQTSGTNEVMRINTTGNVGIGTSSPSERLHVEGNVLVNGNIAAKYQDLAEWVPSSKAIQSGYVVIVDQTMPGNVLPSSEAYDTRVAGVVSESPGIVLGESGNGKVKVATVGRVKVKVDATRNPIQIGDLLVTSGNAGMAMKSEPVDVSGIKMHRPGTLLGKALEPLGSGMGEITVLLSLQ